MSFVDFDLHGFVRVRVLDPQPEDVAVVERQLGPLAEPAATFGSEPDITLRFVDRLTPGRPLTYVGYPEAGHDDESLYLLRGKHGVPALTRIPFQDVGSQRCDIVAERGVGAVPHLLAVVNLTALAKGVLPLHASAFVHDGVGVLATGWSKGGKTETLLAFAALGARYVGDEWIYLTPEGEMYGVPEPIRLWHWHLRQLPQVWHRLSQPARARLDLLSRAADLAERAAARSGPGSSLGSLLQRGAPVVRRQAFRQVPPRDLFGPAGLTPTARLDALLLVRSHELDEVTARPISGDTVADVMRASLAEERAPFLAAYRQFRFAFPDLASDVVERAEELDAKLLRLFAGRSAYEIGHPYPFRLADLVPPVRTALRELAPHVGDPDATAGSTNTGGPS